MVTAKRRGGGISVTNDCRELVVEPHPALIKVEPWATRFGGAGALLVHAVGNRGVLSFILADEEGSTIIANSAEAELVVAIDGKGAGAADLLQLRCGQSAWVRWTWLLLIPRAPHGEAATRRMRLPPRFMRVSTGA